MGRCLHRTSFCFSRELVVGEYTSWYIFIPSRTFIILSVRHRHTPRRAARPAVCGGDIGMAEKSALDNGAASYQPDGLIGYTRSTDQRPVGGSNTSMLQASHISPRRPPALTDASATYPATSPPLP